MLLQRSTLIFLCGLVLFGVQLQSRCLGQHSQPQPDVQQQESKPSEQKPSEPKETKPKSDCESPSFNCPSASLFTDGVFFVYGTSCCTPTGPTCALQFSSALYLYENTIDAADFGCEADPNGAAGCECLTDQNRVGDGSGTGSGGELTFDPDDASAISPSTHCDSYFVKVASDNSYYRVYVCSVNLGPGKLYGGNFAIRSTKMPPSQFPVLAYPTAKVNGRVHKLTVQVPIQGGGTQPTIFPIVQK